MGHKRRSESEVVTRNHGMKYRAEYDASNYAIYEGWALDPNIGESDTQWQILKHTYDASGNLTESDWADGTDDFVKSWALRSTYTY